MSSIINYAAHYIFKLAIFLIPYSIFYYIINKSTLNGRLKKNYILVLGYIAQIYLTLSYFVSAFETARNGWLIFISILIFFSVVSCGLHMYSYDFSDSPIEEVKQSNSQIFFNFFVSALACIMTSCIVAFDSWNSNRYAKEDILKIIPEADKQNVRRIVERDMWIGKVIPQMAELFILFGQNTQNKIARQISNIPLEAQRVSYLSEESFVASALKELILKVESESFPRKK